MPVAKDLKLNAIYLDGDMKDAVEDKGFQASLAYKGAKASVPGSWGLEAKYYDQSAATYVDHTMDGMADNTEMFNNFVTEGFKGYGLIGSYAFAKNIVGAIEWYDLESKGLADGYYPVRKQDMETLWAQVVFTF
jgi:hypothetical protein